MAEKIKFNLKDGTEIAVEPKLLKGYISESTKALTAEANAKAEFKATVETVAETTGLPKSLVSKYFKARFKDATEKDKETGEVFGTLDEALK